MTWHTISHGFALHKRGYRGAVIAENSIMDIAIFTGIMDSFGYQTITKEYLLLFYQPRLSPWP